MAPRPWEGISFAWTSHASPYGEVSLEWRRDDESAAMDVRLVVPPNASETVERPYAALAEVRESGALEAMAGALRPAKPCGWSWGRGRYAFTYPIAR